MRPRISIRESDRPSVRPLKKGQKDASISWPNGLDPSDSEQFRQCLVLKKLSKKPGGKSDDKEGATRRKERRVRMSDKSDGRTASFKPFLSAFELRHSRTKEGDRNAIS